MGRTHNIVRCTVGLAIMKDLVRYTGIRIQLDLPVVRPSQHCPLTIALPCARPNLAPKMGLAVLCDESPSEGNLSYVTASRKACSSMGVLVFTAYMYSDGVVPAEGRDRTSGRAASGLDCGAGL